MWGFETSVSGGKYGRKQSFFAPEFKFRIINEDINRSDCQCIVRELNQAANFQEEEDGKLIREYVGGCTLIKNSCEKPDYIINTAAPYYEMEDEDSLLENCYLSCLEIANENHIHSIAFPLLSTGTHGYPIYEAVPVAFLLLVNGDTHIGIALWK